MSYPPFPPPGSQGLPDDDPTQQVVTCYRHPDRRAGVGCQRCGRPICPSCMMTASVGFQCPECVHSAAGSSPHLTLGALRHGRPIATISLIVLNVVVYGLSGVNSYGGRLNIDGATLYLRGLLAGQCIRSDGQWYRLITGGFLHAGLLHLGMNMFALWIIGQALEPVIGRLRFVLVYMVALLGGSAGVMLLSPNSPTIGASGAIFGMFGALLVVQLMRGVNAWQSGIISLIAVNLLFTFAIPGISIGGHVGGLITGAAAMGVLSVGRDVAHQGPAEHAGRAVLTGFLGVALFALGLALAQRAGYVPPGYCP